MIRFCSCSLILFFYINEFILDTYSLGLLTLNLHTWQSVKINIGRTVEEQSSSGLVLLT